jgi:hypothetical protein
VKTVRGERGCSPHPVVYPPGMMHLERLLELGTRQTGPSPRIKTVTSPSFCVVVASNAQQPPAAAAKAAASNAQQPPPAAIEAENLGGGGTQRGPEQKKTVLASEV